MKIVVLGAGKMGSWLSREFSLDHDVAVYDMDRAKFKAFEGTKTTVLSDMEKIALFNPELLINAVSLQNTVSTFETAVAYISKNCIICDLGTIKGEIAEYYNRSPFRFVSTHPMFGPTFADMDALKEESAIVITESDKKGAEIFRTFFKRLKIKIFEYSFEEHDRMMAYSLTLPFISSMAFASCVDKSVVPGTTFSKHIQIANGLLSEDDQLLTEILFNPYSLAELDRITAKLEYLKHIIREKDKEELEMFFLQLRKNILRGDGMYE
jgi:prephenate dehydrogenase